MKRSTFIIVGFSIILLLFAIWAYSLLYGTPQRVGDIFANFGILGGNGSTTIITTPAATTTPDVPKIPVNDRVKLRQLTTRPVIGFREFQASSTEPKFITYAEAGTGHIYTINLATGEEIRVSQVTVPIADKAVFSAGGRFVAIQSGYTSQNHIVLIDLEDLTNVQSEILPYAMTDFNFSPNDELVFIEQTSTGTAGHTYNPITKVLQNTFTIPFQTVTMVWSTGNNTPDYVYPKATSALYGYLYKIVGGTIQRVPIDGVGLMVKANSDYIIFNQQIDSQLISSVHKLKTLVTENTLVPLIPDKCTFLHQNNSTVYCGYEITDYSYSFPDDWYKGARNFNDGIWKINLITHDATPLQSPNQLVGRDIDIDNMSADQADTILFFTNKNDNTLWAYEI